MDTLPIIVFLAVGLLLACSLFSYTVFTLLKRIVVLENKLTDLDKNTATTNIFLKSILLTSLVTQQGVNTLLSLMSKRGEIVNQEVAAKSEMKIH